MIEKAYLLGEEMGMVVLCQDEAGPYQTKPHPGGSWQVAGQPAKYDHEYIRNGTAKIMTLLRPKTGQVEITGVTSTANKILHPWLKENILAINKNLPQTTDNADSERKSKIWKHFESAFWSKDYFEKLPTPKIILVWDNLAGHKSYEMVKWLYENGVVPLYTPLGGSWLNMAESIQGVLKMRALAGLHPQTPQDIIDNFEAAAKGWNKNPTPFIWKGKRFERRRRAWDRHRLAASGATVPPYRGTSYWTTDCTVQHVK